MNQLPRILTAYPQIFSLQSAFGEHHRERQVRSFKIPARETILGVYDTTVTRIGTRGLLFTDKALYWNASGSHRDETPVKSGRLSYPTLCKCQVRVLVTPQELVIEVVNFDESRFWNRLELRPALRGTSVEVGFTQLFRAIGCQGSGYYDQEPQSRAFVDQDHPRLPGRLEVSSRGLDHHHRFWFGSNHN